MIIEKRGDSNLPVVSVVIPTHNRKKELFSLVDSILSSDYPQEEIEIVIVDDASEDGTFTAVKSRYQADNIKIIRSERNLLVAQARNIGIMNATGEYIFFIDDDFIIAKNTVSLLIKFLQEDKNNSIIGPIILSFNNPDYICSAGIKINFFTTLGNFIGRDQLDKGQFKYPIKSDALIGTFMVHRNLMNRAGFFNSELFPWAFEEMDFSIRAGFLGYKILRLPSAKAWHRDHIKGDYLEKPQELYYGVRNRIIAHKLWSRNSLEDIFSRLFSVLFAFVCLFLKNSFYPRNYFRCTDVILRGLWDGLRLSLGVESYPSRLKKGKDIKYICKN